MMKLRRATLGDESRLLAWRNDDRTRLMGTRTMGVVSKTDHANWLRSVLHDETRLLFIAMERNRPYRALGTGRLDFYGDLVEINLTIAPEHRGQGHASRLIALLMNQARRRHRGADVRAWVKPENVYSIRAFLKAGFVVERPGFVILKPRGF